MFLADTSVKSTSLQTGIVCPYCLVPVVTHQHLPWADSSCPSRGWEYSGPSPFKIPAGSSFVLNIILWKPKAGVAMQSKAQISMQKAGAFLNTLSMLVIALFAAGGGVAVHSTAQSDPNQCKPSTEPCGAGSVSPRRALRCPGYLYSFTSKSEPPLCSSPWKSKSWQLSDPTSSLSA